MIKNNIFSIGLLLISLNIYGQTTYTFLDSISNEPISGVVVFSNDSLISISNVDGLVRIDKTNEQIFSIKHSLYYQKNIKLKSNVIVLSPRYQFLEEVTVKYEDCFDLFEMLLKENRERNNQLYQYVKCNYYKQIITVDENMDTSKMNFSAVLYVDLTDLKNKIVYIDSYDKKSSINPDKLDKFYSSAKASLTNMISFNSLINQLFFPIKKTKRKKFEGSLTKSDDLTKISLKKIENNNDFERRLTYRRADSTITEFEQVFENHTSGTGNVKILSPFFNIIICQADSINLKNTFISSESEAGMEVFDKKSSAFGFQYVVVDKLMTADEFKSMKLKEIEDLYKFIEEANDTENSIIPLIKSRNS